MDQSTSGFFFCLNSSPISWISKKQASTATSTCAAEYYVLCEATKEALYLRKVLDELNVPQSRPTTIKEDNTSAISIAKQTNQTRLKHLEVKYFFIKEHLDKGEIQIVDMPSYYQLADTLTKKAEKSVIKRTLEALNIRNLI